MDAAPAYVAAFHCELVLVRLTEVLIRNDTLSPVLAIASPVLA
jgi:hypothetical protein